MSLAVVRRTIEVAVDPATAFDVFTAEIGVWWRPGRHSLRDPERTVDVRFEPWVGGRWVEVWDADSGDGYERGRVLAWEPGRRLVVTYCHELLPPEPLTELEVRFEPTGAGTRVVLEHRGWDQLPPAVVERFVRRDAWSGVVRWYAGYLASRGT